MKKIAIIGAGNIGMSIVFGILKNNFFQSNEIIATRGENEKLDDLIQLGIDATHDNLYAVKNAEIVLLALKPHLIVPVLNQLKTELRQEKILISVATKNSIETIEENSLKNIPIFRVIPNTAASIGSSLTCICSKNANENQIKYVQEIFNQIGETVLIDESMLNQATVLGSSGTAFALRYIRAMIQAGIEIGFDEKTSKKIVSQTVKGASELLLINQSHPEQEIDKVTTPKGCTIAGLNEMEHNGFSSAIIKSVVASLKSLG